MQSERMPSTTYHVTMDDDKLGLKPGFFIELYSKILSETIDSAPSSIRKEIAVLQDGTIKTKFNIAVSSRMAPYLINTIQQRINEEKGIGLRSYLCKLQEQVMHEIFASQRQTPINIQFDSGSLFL